MHIRNSFKPIQKSTEKSGKCKHHNTLEEENKVRNCVKRKTKLEAGVFIENFEEK